MSLSAEEKRQLLRERRQAKMAQGKGTDRLNEILTQGSSVKTAHVAPTETAEATGSATGSATASATASAFPQKPSTIAIDEDPAPTPLHGDPEVADISQLLHQNDTPEDMEAVFQQIFANANPNINLENPQTPQDNSAKFFADLMKAMTEGQDGNAPGAFNAETPQEASYQQKLAQYQAYQQKAWKAGFLLVRFILHTFNFFYHYRLFESFLASSYSYVRELQSDSTARLFFIYYVSCEIAIITSYFTIMSKNGLLKASSQNHAILKLISLGSSLYPQIANFQLVVNTVLVYWSGISILFGDLMLIVVYFGIVSVLSR